jgi:hypothetical protein
MGVSWAYNGCIMGVSWAYHMRINKPVRWSNIERLTSCLQPSRPSLLLRLESDRCFSPVGSFCAGRCPPIGRQSHVCPGQLERPHPCRLPSTTPWRWCQPSTAQRRINVLHCTAKCPPLMPGDTEDTAGSLHSTPLSCPVWTRPPVSSYSSFSSSVSFPFSSPPSGIDNLGRE